MSDGDMFNILKFEEDNHCIMLGVDVSWFDAHYWIDYYRHNYGVGVPFPNGKGYYEGVFIIVRKDEETGLYRAVH